MESLMVGCAEDLYQQCAGKSVYIYGAKTIAQRANLYLKSRGTEAEGFLVSNRYGNPDMVLGKTVYRIEELDRHLECVVVAVSAELVRDVEKELQRYDIEKIVVIHPAMDDAFPIGICCSERSRISERAFIEKEVQIFVDETSTIIIEDNAVIKNGTVILVSDNSVLRLGKNSLIGEHCKLFIADESSVEIGECSSIGRRTTIGCRVRSEFYIGDNTVLEENATIALSHNSEFSCKGNNVIRETAKINCHRKAYVIIKEQATINSNIYLTAEASNIEIGEDAMLSRYIKMNTGTHKLMDLNTGKDITNYKPIIIGDHVWVGMGAILLSGADVKKGSVVGAGALVNKTIPEKSVCVGNPARIVRENVEWAR